MEQEQHFKVFGFTELNFRRKSFYFFFFFFERKEREKHGFKGVTEKPLLPLHSESSDPHPWDALLTALLSLKSVSGGNKSQEA